MGMTMTQKILAAHAGLDSVKAGDLIEAKLDLVLGNDVTTPVAVDVFNQAGFTKIFDKDKILHIPFFLAFSCIFLHFLSFSHFSFLFVIKNC